MKLCPEFKFKNYWASFKPCAVFKKPDKGEKEEKIYIKPDIYDIEKGEDAIKITILLPKDNECINGKTNVKDVTIVKDVTTVNDEDAEQLKNISQGRITTDSSDHRDSDDNIPHRDGSSAGGGRKTVTELLQDNYSDPEHSKRGGVIAPHVPIDSLSELQYEINPKDYESRELIIKAFMANEFINCLMSKERLKAAVEAMKLEKFKAGSFIIHEGASRSHIYVSSHGQFEVLKNGQLVKTFGPGEAFGELAVLYNTKRSASIRCVTDAEVWSLERLVFHTIIVRSDQQERQDYVQFLASVPQLQGVHPIELGKLSEFLKRLFFPSGATILRQGDRGDKFYIIRGGKVAVTEKYDDGSEERVAVLSSGEFFGEQALLHNTEIVETFTAEPPGVECLVLERDPFSEILGDVPALRGKRHSSKRNSQQSIPPPIKNEFEFVTLKDLKVKATLGAGAFGRVELVQYKHDRKITFALKCLKKKEMNDQQQQEHVFNEKDIMMSCDSPFICRLYRTFKDKKYLYFLLEPVMGGDLWSLLRKKQYLSEKVAKFMIACVVEAFQYLHSKDIIYRDLKPENLMIDEQGYLKLVDFGFAKRIPPYGRTWTFGGTPEYIAPEIILNKGHGKAVDCWALGILTYELLVGRPPFRVPGGNHWKTYKLILKGIDELQWNRRITTFAQLLICQLCRSLPAERLGYLKNGIADIKTHRWFSGMDWQGLVERRLRAPLIPRVDHNLDRRNFTTEYPKDILILPDDDISDWDKNF